MKRIVLVVCLFIIAGMAQAADSTRCSINVRAQVEVTAKADRAVFSFTIDGMGSTLRTAVDNARARVRAITDTLKQIGLTDKDFSTSSFYIGENLGKKAFLSSKKDYKTSITVTVNLNDLSLLEETVLFLSEVDLDNFSGINFVLHDMEELRITALEKALKKARQKADMIAEIMGSELGELISFNENTTNNDYQRSRGSRSFSNSAIDMDGLGGDVGGAFFSPDRKLIVAVNAVIAIKGVRNDKSVKLSMNDTE